MKKTLAKEIFKQINNITTIFIEDGLSMDQNFPIKNENKLFWTGFSDISYILKNEDYNDIYKEIKKKKDFNIFFIDGAIIQFMYEFNNNSNKILKQRLAYFPNAETDILSNFDEYTDRHYNSISDFSDIFTDKNLVCPVRFDFDQDEIKFIKCLHSYSHCTLANYKNCRIPVIGPITPYRFINFILKNFYNNLYIEKYKERFKCDIKIDCSLLEEEKEEMYFSFK